MALARRVSGHDADAHAVLRVEQEGLGQLHLVLHGLLGLLHETVHGSVGIRLNGLGDAVDEDVEDVEAHGLGARVLCGLDLRAEERRNDALGRVRSRHGKGLFLIKSDKNKLKNILSKIQGVGEVEVCLNYSESSEVVAMYNENSTTSTTEETDDTGGTRKIEETDTQKDVIYKEEDGTKTPITAKVVEPKIEGAIITAKGANNSEIKNNIIQAVEAITGLATHKIQVFEMQ